MVEANQVPQVKLNSGKDMPQIGLGTFLAPSEEIKAIVKAAVLKYGYRHIDTASLYGNEEAIGDALQEVYAESEIKREDIYLVTKLWVDEREDVEGAVKRSLGKLKCEYLDLYLMHYVNVPINYKEGTIKPIPIEKTWKDMEACVKSGLIRSIGVSNCPVIMLMNIIAGAEIPPANNQVEMHPYFVRKPFLEFHKKFNVSVTAYAPIGAPGFGLRPDAVKTLDLFNEPVIKELADKYSKSPAQVILAWHLSRGVIIIPKTTKEARLPENISVLDFKLTEEEAAKIEKLDAGVRFFNPVHLADYGWDNLPYYE